MDEALTASEGDRNISVQVVKNESVRRNIELQTPKNENAASTRLHEESETSSFESRGQNEAGTTESHGQNGSLALVDPRSQNGVSSSDDMPDLDEVEVIHPVPMTSSDRFRSRGSGLAAGLYEYLLTKMQDYQPPPPPPPEPGPYTEKNKDLPPPGLMEASVYDTTPRNKRGKFITPPYPVEYTCKFCHRDSFVMLVCRGCKKARYCNESHQERHWPYHLNQCINDEENVEVVHDGCTLEIEIMLSDMEDDDVDDDEIEIEDITYNKDKQREIEESKEDKGKE